MHDTDVRDALRYVTRRRNADGSVRWYWQRRGFSARRLPDDAVLRVAEARRLNAEADGGGTAAWGTVGWAILKYQGSERWRELAPASQRAYQRWLDEIEEVWRDTPCAGLTRPVLLEWRDGLPAGTSTRRHAIAALSLVLGAAHDYGAIPANPALRLRAGPAGRRSQVWTRAQVEALVAAADGGRRLAVQLLRYTGQRPGDVLAMTWSAYDGETIEVRQQKTGKLLRVPCHAELRAELDAARPLARSVLVCTRRGRPIGVAHLTCWWRGQRAALGLAGLQLRDLRRTAVVALAEAGATVPQIAAVTGHELGRTAKILATYLPPDVAVAREAIRLLERRDRERGV